MRLTSVSVSPLLKGLIERELVPGEVIVWQAMPEVGSRVRHTSGDFLFGVFFIAVAAILGFFSTGTVSNPFKEFGFTPVTILFAVGFGFVILKLLLAPFWAWWDARHTAFVITDRRAILIEAPFRRTIRSFYGDRSTSIVRHEDRQGRGDLIFHREEIRSGKSSYYRDVGFRGLSDAKAVEELLRRTFNNSSV